MSGLIERINLVDSKYGTLLFYIGMSVLLLFHGWYEFSDFPVALHSFYFTVSLLCLCLFLIRILLLAPRHPRFVAGTLLLLAFLCICYAYSKRAEPLFLVLSVAASRYSNLRTTSLLYVIAIMVITAMIPVFYSMGLTDDVVKRLGDYSGHSWGFFNPNVLAEVVMCGLFAALFYFKVRRVRYMVPICWISALAIGMVTLCRSITIALVLFPLFFALVRMRKGIWRLESLPVLMLAVSIILACHYGPVLGENSFASRFSIPYYVYELAGVSLLGGGNAVPSGVDIDNFILHHVLNSGILVGGLLSFLYGCLLYRIGRRNRDPYQISMICLVTLLGFFTITPLDPLRNFLLLSFFDD